MFCETKAREVSHMTCSVEVYGESQIFRSARDRLKWLFPNYYFISLFS